MTADRKSRKNRAPLNLAMGLVGLLAILLVIVAAGAGWPVVIVVLGLFTVMLSLATMFFTRKSDEYTLGLWSTSANAAFATVIFFALFAAFGEAFYVGFMQAHEGIERERLLDGDFAAIAAILAFYLTFNIKRLTGAV